MSPSLGKLEGWTSMYMLSKRSRGNSLEGMVNCGVIAEMLLK